MMIFIHEKTAIECGSSDVSYTVHVKDIKRLKWKKPKGKISSPLVITTCNTKCPAVQN